MLLTPNMVDRLNFYRGDTYGFLGFLGSRLEFEGQLSGKGSQKMTRIIE